MNREYTLYSTGFSDGIHTFDSNRIAILLESIPSDMLFPLSEYENSMRSKQWWTMEITDSIIIQEDDQISVTYLSYHTMT